MTAAVLGFRVRRRRAAPPYLGGEVVDLAEQRRLYGLAKRVRFVNAQLTAGAMTGAEALKLLHELKQELEAS